MRNFIGHLIDDISWKATTFKTRKEDRMLGEQLKQNVEKITFKDLMDFKHRHFGLSGFENNDFLSYGGSYREEFNKKVKMAKLFDKEVNSVMVIARSFIQGGNIIHNFSSASKFLPIWWECKNDFFAYAKKVKRKKVIQEKHLAKLDRLFERWYNVAEQYDIV